MHLNCKQKGFLKAFVCEGLVASLLGVAGGGSDQTDRMLRHPTRWRE